MGAAEQLKDQIKSATISEPQQPVVNPPHNSVFSRLFSGNKVNTKAAKSLSCSDVTHNYTSDSHDYTAESRLKKAQTVGKRRDSSNGTGGKNLNSTTNSSSSSSSSSSSTRRLSSDSDHKLSPNKISNTKVPNSNNNPNDAKGRGGTQKLSEYEKQIMSGECTVIHHIFFIHMKGNRVFSFIHYIFFITSLNTIVIILFLILISYSFLLFFEM